MPGNSFLQHFALIEVLEPLKIPFMVFALDSGRYRLDIVFFVVQAIDESIETDKRV